MKKNKLNCKLSIFQRFKREIRRNWILYLMLLPVVVYFVIYKYWPMYGVQLAFKRYNSKLGILGSPWIGFDHFERFFKSYYFKNLIINTLTLSLYNLVVGFPLAILFALMLNYLKLNKLKKVVQMVSYAPHFISTVVICGMITLFFSNSGIINNCLNALGIETVQFLAKPEYFKHVYTWSGIWQSIGWNSIIYISALSGVDYQMHEAAIIDGATIPQRMFHIDLPSIKPTIAMLLILQMGNLMAVGFEKVYLLSNSLNNSAASVIATYTYELGLVQADYAFSTAVNLFNTLINMTLVIAANFISKKLTSESIL